MKIIHKFISHEIELNPQKICILAIENQNLLYSFVEELSLAIDGTSEDINLIDDNKRIVDTSQITFIMNIFNLDFNEKKIINALSKKLCKELRTYEYELNSLYCNISNLIDKAIYNMDSAVILNPALDINLLLKCFSPKIECDYTTLIEKLINYINVLIEFTNLKSLFFLNLQCFMSKEDIEKLFEHCRYKEVSILLLESANRYTFENIKCLIVDKDLCELVE